MENKAPVNTIMRDVMPPDHRGAAVSAPQPVVPHAPAEIVNHIPVREPGQPPAPVAIQPPLQHRTAAVQTQPTLSGNEEGLEQILKDVNRGVANSTPAPAKKKRLTANALSWKPNIRLADVTAVLIAVSLVALSLSIYHK